jgi:hypothetical protein
MTMSVEFNEKEATRYSKLVLSYLLLLIGIIYFIGFSGFSSSLMYADFISPLINVVALSPLWMIIATTLQTLIENFWPLLLIYYGSKWVFQFEKKPAK